MSRKDIFILNPRPDLAGRLLELSGGEKAALAAAGPGELLGPEAEGTPLVMIAEAGLASYENLRRFISPETSIIITAESEAEAERAAQDWPPEFCVDTLTVAAGRPWEDAFLTALRRALAQARKKAEVEGLRRALAEREAKVREVLKEIHEIRSLINVNLIKEVEKRIAVEARYIWFQKEKQRLEGIVRKIYEANDVGSLLDVIPEIRDAVKAQSASVYIVEQSETSGRFLKPILWDNAFLVQSEFNGFVFSLDSPGFAPSAVVYKSPVHVTDFSTADKAAASRYKLLLKTSPRTLLAVPIMHGSEVIGVIEVYNKLKNGRVAAEGFSRDDREILLSLSEHMALAMMKLNLIHYDALTGLLRPEPFLDMVLQRINSMGKRSREEGHMALVMGDVDWFKNYNDRNGQEAGNVLLRELARVLRSSIREEDLLCRYGGEEFLFFLTGVKSVEEACLLTERIRKNVEDHYFEFQEFQPRGNLTMSFGVTVFPKKKGGLKLPLARADLKRLAAEADLALAEAKGKMRPELAGREESAEPSKNKVSCFDLIRPEAVPEAPVRIEPPPTFQEMRRQERFSVSTVLMFREKEGFKVAKTANLSAGGARVITNSSLPVDTTLETLLVIEDIAQAILSDVVYSEKSGVEPAVFYSGLKFKNLSYRELSLLENFLAGFRKKV
jgi:diguanylate cyclase (GGDEF)-like protein